jgi:hypothetical protein
MRPSIRIINNTYSPFLSKALLTAQTTYKAAHFNTTRQNTELKKKVEELEKVKTEASTGLVKVK